MQEMASIIKSRQLPFNSQSQTVAKMRQANRENAERAIPTLALQGVPGEYDFRKFLTDPLQNMVPVHFKAGGTVVSSLAVATNANQWRDRENDPGRYGGFFSPAGEYEAAQVSETVLIQDLEIGGYKPYEYSNLPQVEVAPTKAVVMQKSSAKPFSINVLQTTDPA